MKGKITYAPVQTINFMTEFCFVKYILNDQFHPISKTSINNDTIVKKANF